jgi:hypothetical protein
MSGKSGRFPWPVNRNTSVFTRDSGDGTCCIDGLPTASEVFLGNGMFYDPAGNGISA